MCGIAGIVTLDKAFPNEGVLRGMSQAIAHRGPDGDGMWLRPGIGLAHRRLSIIDLNPTGAQPMHDASEMRTIIFNGEIYNYRALRDELAASGATFRSTSDTEVVLAAYRKWGTECVKRVHGMFAFALWDQESGSLLFARDRIGKKPLYYTRSADGSFLFASELKALAAAVPFEPDWEAVRLFLGLQYVPSPRTGFRGVFQLEPGHFGIVQNGELNIQSYHTWDTTVVSRQVKDVDQQIRTLLEEAVRMRQVASDVPVGAFLSGGIDSAAVVAYAAKHVSSPLQTFTMGFASPRMDERAQARDIARAFGTEHHEFEAKPEDLVALIDELTAHYDAPYADSSSLPLWLLSRETAKQIKVVLTGDGGDELFGGYRRYSFFERAQLIAKFPGASSVLSAAAEMASDPPLTRMAETVAALGRNPSRAYGEMFCGSYFGSSSLRASFTEEFLSETQSADAVTFVSQWAAGPMADAPLLQRAMYFDLTSYLPDDLNVKMDRATMRFGLEARSPFLDQDLVAFALTLPMHERVRGGKTKIALKRALRGDVPDDVLTRKKRGFQVPLGEWFSGPLRDLVHERLLDPKAPIARILRPSAVTRLIAANERSNDHGNRLWMLLTLSTWLNHYGI